jgi:hypothetical protein
MQDYQTISLDDIKKEKESSIKEISESKTSVEEEISNVVNKIDDTIEELEKTYNSNLESVSKSLKKSVKIFGDKAKKVKEGFSGVFIIIIIIIIYLSIEIITSYHSGNLTSSNSSTQILSLSVPSIALILILGLVFKVYKNISSDNSSEINEEINNIDKNIISALDIPSYPQKIEIEKSFFDEKKAILSSVLSSVAKLIPVVEKIYDEVNLLVEYQQIVHDFESCLEFYNLVEDKKSLEKIGKYAPADAHILIDKDLWKKLVAQKIVSQLNTQKIGQKFTFSENLLLLLYKEHNGEQSTSVFRDIVGSDNEVQMLASVLIYSQKLTRSNDYEYKKEDIVAIIKKEECFSLPNINDSLSNILLRYRQLIKDFKFCLEFYNLIEDKKFFEEKGEFAPLYNYIINNESLWEEITAIKISCHLNTQRIGKKFTFSKNLLLLMYDEHKCEPSTCVFREVIGSDDEIQVLASVLIYSQKLTRSNDYEYKNKDIVAIIRKEELFSLPNINNTLSNSFLILNYLNSYVEFLKKNGIEISYEPTIEYIINKSEGISSERRVTKLAYNLGLDNFNKIDGLNRYFADGFARASLALKFHDDVSLREMVCKCSANNYSTAILYSYFEKVKENDGQKIVLVRELTNNIEHVNFFLNKLEDPDIKFFQAQLKDGQWHDSSFSLLREFFKKSKEEILEKLSSIDELEMLKESIKSIYREVNIETIEKSIDAQLFGVYVIMFHSTGSQNSGNNEDTLRDIIDKLSIRDLDQKDREKKWEFRDDRQKEEIKEKYKVYPKYDFINFSKSTRIGILDKDQPFQDFKEDFFNDVKTILNSKDEHFDIGIIVHKIMPSKHTFGMLDKDKLSDKIEIKDLDAVKYIARLATKIPLEDQVSGMKLEKINLLKIIDEKSFYEILKFINNDIKDQIEIDVLNDPELKICLLNELNEKLSISDFKSLALDLKGGIYEERDIKKISKVIESVLRSRYLIEESLKRRAKSRSEILSKRFIKSLKNLASLYELQRND